MEAILYLFIFFSDRLPVKRHARVKTWTRKLDLFEKDFIVIPINEQ
jgi:Ulp1 family protease